MLRRLSELGERPTDPMLGISISQQRSFFFKNKECELSFPVSTSKNSPSEVENSFGTPRGLHAVAEKYGEGAPSGMVFKGRVATGKLYSEFDGEERRRNLITSRILRLKGIESGKNAGPGVDSYERFIYLHGTNHEDRIGRPFSGGCIEFTNRAIIQLFDQVPVGALVWIEDSAEWFTNIKKKGQDDSITVAS